MKKLIITIVTAIALLIPAAASAQFRYGPTAGIDLTTLKFKQDLVTIDQSIGYQAGVRGEMMFPGIGFGIDLGLMYVQRGATLHLGEKTIWASEGYLDPRSYLHYIEIPINLKFKWTRMQGLEEYVAPYVFGGPTISILAAHSDIPALQYAGADLGLQCGVGVELYRHWLVQGSYNWGMTYALKTKLLDNFSAQNRTWSLSVTYLF